VQWIAGKRGVRTAQGALDEFRDSPGLSCGSAVSD
jgi:hypothetical protein